MVQKKREKESFHMTQMENCLSLNPGRSLVHSTVLCRPIQNFKVEVEQCNKSDYVIILYDNVKRQLKVKYINVHFITCAGHKRQ